jgi:hypothetical protein
MLKSLYGCVIGTHNRSRDKGPLSFRSLLNFVNAMRQD